MNAPDTKISKKSSENLEKDQFPIFAPSKSPECSKFSDISRAFVGTCLWCVHPALPDVVFPLSQVAEGVAGDGLPDSNRICR